jgi:5-methylcytosine-specific restriction protein A
MKKPKIYRKKTTGKTFKSKKNSRYERQKFYQSKEWTQLRFKFLAKNEKCFTCGDKSNTLDHIVTHKGDLKLFWNEQNYMPLCSSCHSIITARFDKHVPQLLEQKMLWVKRMRKINDLNFGIKVVRIDENGKILK